MEIFLAFGSNTGDRASCLEAAIKRLAPGIEVKAQSSTYETEPKYLESQPRFLNKVCCAETKLSAHAVLRYIKRIETDMGRKPSPRFAPRIIDIDLLLYGEEHIEDSELTVPHPRMAERAFVLVPLQEIAPDVVIHILGSTVMELCEKLGDTSKDVWRVTRSLSVGSTTFQWGIRTYVMGIINATPDSFSGDGVMSVESAIRLGCSQVEDGADIVDVGGESTRPGSHPVGEEEELARVIPIISGLAKVIKTPISIDTYKAEVAQRAIEAGACMINDVWALKMDPKMAAIAAYYKVPIVLMHNRSKPKDAVQKEILGGRYEGVVYEELLGDIKAELVKSTEQALESGVERERIILDPGIGFGKTVEQNLELLDRFRELTELGFPLLAGPSRKSFVGFTLNLPTEERLEGTAAAVALSIDRGVDIVRVHDVKAMRRVAHFTDSVVRRSRV